MSLICKIFGHSHLRREAMRQRDGSWHSYCRICNTPLARVGHGVRNALSESASKRGGHQTPVAETTER
jgi:hypothetical protein